ncbi:MAG: NAD(P)H-hydrate dehydratase [Fulvivirga sp.]
MKILSTAQIQKVDQFTIEHEPIPSIELMERAAKAFIDLFFEQISPKNTIVIVCGRGNNGGDGLAIARLLLQRHYPVTTYVIENQKTGSKDFEINKKRLSEIDAIHDIHNDTFIPDFAECDIIIDALFGSGLSRPVEGLYANVVEAINKSGGKIYAVDIASGLFADKPTKQGAVVNADVTISFQLPKLAFFLPSNFQYVGDWHIVNIGLDEDFINKQSSDFHLVTHEYVGKLIKARSKFDHKGTWGRALIMAGSFGKMGAAVLAGRGALRSGIGLLTMYVPGCGYNIVQTTIPEAMAIVDDGDHFLTTCPEVKGYDVIGIGPGIGTEQETMMSLIEMVRAFQKPIVLDADAINLMADHQELLKMLPKGSIITPHPKEFERLVGKWENDFERLDRQKELAEKYKIIVVVKGAHTATATPDGEVFFNSTGNAGMATGGSGDVLTGIVTALLGQGYEPKNAALLGVYLHGLSGDLASDNIGQTSLIASDIIDYLPEAFGIIE